MAQENFSVFKDDFAADGHFEAFITTTQLPKVCIYECGVRHWMFELRQVH